MVYYTDSPRMNKRMVAGYYLFLCLIGFAVLLGPTGAGIPIGLVGNDGRNPHETAQPNWGTVDPTSCETCHPDEYANWSTTHHATSVTVINSTYVSIGPHELTWTLFNSSCAQCHTTGYNATDHSYAVLGIGCYDCHNTTSPYYSYSADVCAPCHTGTSVDHPYEYTQWENSAHANSLTDVRSSSHASSMCMHCMSTEGFINQTATLDVNGDYNSVDCQACHDVHGEWSNVGPAQIRAVNVTELCGQCHSGRYATYELWIGSPHELAGLQCTNCHGYDLTNASDTSTYFLNHTFVVKPELACGPPGSGCHEDNLQWALNQLQSIQSAFNGMVSDIQSEIDSLHTTIVAYNATDGANHTLVNEVQDVIDSVQSSINTYGYDGSSGFHNNIGEMQGLNTAYTQLLNEKAYFYESVPPETVTVTNTVTNTVTTTVTTPVMDPLFTAGGAVGGIIIGLVLGLLVGRRR